MSAGDKTQMLKSPASHVGTPSHPDGRLNMRVDRPQSVSSTRDATRGVRSLISAILTTSAILWMKHVRHITAASALASHRLVTSAGSVVYSKTYTGILSTTRWPGPAVPRLGRRETMKAGREMGWERWMGCEARDSSGS